MEMIVVMTITSIVIIIAIMAYSVINKHFIDYQRQSAFVNNVSQFINAFENDLNSSTDLLIVTNEIVLNKETLDCKYIIDNHSITRQISNKSDTILNSILQIELVNNFIDERTGMIIFNFILSQDTLVYQTIFSRKIDRIELDYILVDQ